MSELVDGYLRRWGAERDGPALSTPSSILIPARRGAHAVMLKIATGAEEARGNRLMVRWNGRAAAAVLEHDRHAVLLERATGTRSLVEMAQAGDVCDDAATRILCRAGTRLHALDDVPQDDAIGLEPWFRDLFAHADAVGGFHARAAVIARELLDNQQQVRVLHGDLHHGNVLDFGADRHPKFDGWLAIDPKYLLGDRAFDFTNILCNPSPEVASKPGRFARQLAVICDAADLERTRLVRWCIAWCALSTAWLGSGEWYESTLALGLQAERMLAAG
jgi:streptomycin 6-kinase